MGSRSLRSLEEEGFRVAPIGGACTWRGCKDLAYFGHTTCNLVDGEEVWAGGNFCQKHSRAFVEKMFLPTKRTQ